MFKPEKVVFAANNASKEQLLVPNTEELDALAMRIGKTYFRPAGKSDIGKFEEVSVRELMRRLVLMGILNSTEHQGLLDGDDEV